MLGRQTDASHAIIKRGLSDSRSAESCKIVESRWYLLLARIEVHGKESPVASVTGLLKFPRSIKPFPGTWHAYHRIKSVTCLLGKAYQKGQEKTFQTNAIMTNNEERNV